MKRQVKKEDFEDGLFTEDLVFDYPVTLQLRVNIFTKKVYFLVIDNHGHIQFDDFDDAIEHFNESVELANRRIKQCNLHQI